MNLTDIANFRVLSQQLEKKNFTTAKEIVGWMGAMQAQDYFMVKWAVGIRLPNSTDRDIETAIDRGEVIRTHLLRPTWHLVSAADIHWMLELTAHQIKATLKSRHSELGLSEEIMLQSNALIRQALSDGNHLTRNEILSVLDRNGVPTDENRAYHLLLRAELDGIICSGMSKGKNPTYALLEERVPKPTPLSRETALANLAIRYFVSHGPATLQDFGWWSGFPVNDATRALEMAKPGLVSEKIGPQVYWFSNSTSVPARDTEKVCLLPAYDELLISYKDRSASLPFEKFKKAVSDNGIFRPVILVNGQVVGLWKRDSKKDKVIVEAELFKQPEKATIIEIEHAAVHYGNYLEKDTEFHYKF